LGASYLTLNIAYLPTSNPQLEKPWPESKPDHVILVQYRAREQAGACDTAPCTLPFSEFASGIACAAFRANLEKQSKSRALLLTPGFRGQKTIEFSFWQIT
jgi:hypothetical protein